MAYYKKDQLSIKTRKLFADYLADLILIADSIESFRVALAQTEFFNGIQLFRWLDKDEKGYLTPQDFASLVSDQTRKVFHYAFSWFDVSKVGEITRAEFLEFLFPKTNQQLRNIVSERMLQEFTPEQRKITLPIQQGLLQELILQIMQKQTRLIPFRRNLMDQDDYTLKAAMNCLDVEGRGWITTGDIYKFLGNFDIDVDTRQVCSMLGIYDNDLNGKISLNQLEWLVQGLEKNSSSYRKIVRGSDRKAKLQLRNQICTCYKQDGRKSSEKQKIKIQQQSKAQTAKKKVKKEKDENRYSDRKENKSKQKHNFKRDIVNEFSENISEKKMKKKQKNQTGINSKFQYLQLKNAVLALEKQTQEIDEDLIRIEQEMGAKTQKEFEQELENAQIKRKLKKQQEQRIKIRLQELQMLELEKQRQALRRIKEEENIRLMEEQNRRILELEKVRALERQNEYFRQNQERRLREAELQNIRLRQLQEARLREGEQRRIAAELEQNRLTSLRRMTQAKFAEQENRRTIEMEQERLEYLKRIKEMQLNNLLSKKKLEGEIFDREIRGGLESNIKLVRSQLDWNSQAKLRLLHEEEVMHRLAKDNVTEKENQYFWRYNNYCQNLANVVDPLGIKEHLAQTDKYLMKSKELRDQIKRDRVYSATKPSNLKTSNRRNKIKVETQNDEVGERTPEQRRDVIETINKRTQQTKLAWSES